MFAPGSQMGPITDEQRRASMASSIVAGVYEQEVDRESALEMLTTRLQESQQAAPRGATAAETARPRAPEPQSGLGALIFGSTGPRGGKRDGLVDLMAKSAARSAGSA